MNDALEPTIRMLYALVVSLNSLKQVQRGPRDRVRRVKGGSSAAHGEREGVKGVALGH